MNVKIKSVQEVNITKDDFKDYEKVRSSGLTNMFNISQVIALNKNLTREKCIAIMENYERLKKEFPEVCV